MLVYAPSDSPFAAKRKTDDMPFYGQLLDVAYAPQFESVSDTREKLEERKAVVLQKLHPGYYRKQGMQTQCT